MNVLLNSVNHAHRFESLHSLNVSLYCPLILEQRGQVVAMAIEYTAAFGFRQETMYDGLQVS